MRFDLSKLEFKDIILAIGIIGSIFGAAVAYSSNTSRTETALEEIKTLKIEIFENRKLDYEQSLILKEITVNMNNLVDVVKELKQKRRFGND